MAKGTYFTVPLAILRTGRDEQDCLENIISLGLWYAGEGFRQANEEHVVSAFLGSLCDGSETEDEENVAIGADIIGVTSGDFDQYAIRALNVRELLEDVDSVSLRIKADYVSQTLEKCRTPNDTSGLLCFDELRVIMAIASCLAKRGRKWRAISRTTVQVRASGYLRRADFAQAKQNAPWTFPPLSDWQARKRLDNLEALGILKRLPIRRKGKFGGRSTAVTFSLSLEELAQEVSRWLAAGDWKKEKIREKREEGQRLLHRAENMGEPPTLPPRVPPRVPPT